MMLRGRRDCSAFGNMCVLRQMHHDALAADARSDAVDQCRHVVIVLRARVEIALLLHHDFSAARGQANEIETEAGIERIGQCIEPLAKQPVDEIRLGDRLSGLHTDAAHRAVGAEEACFQHPRALAGAIHRGDQRLRKTR